MEDEEKIISSGNDYVDIGLSFVPFLGAAMDIEDAWRDPSLENIAWATGSTLLDFFGGSFVKGAAKSLKASNKALKSLERLEKAEQKYQRAFKAAQNNPTRGTSKLVRRTFVELRDAKKEADALAPLVKRRGVRRVPHYERAIPSDQTQFINKRNIRIADALANSAQLITTYKNGGNMTKLVKKFNTGGNFIPKARTGMIFDPNLGLYRNINFNDITNYYQRDGKKLSGRALKRLQDQWNADPSMINQEYLAWDDAQNRDSRIDALTGLIDGGFYNGFSYSGGGATQADVIRNSLAALSNDQLAEIVQGNEFNAANQRRETAAIMKMNDYINSLKQPATPAPVQTAPQQDIDLSGQAPTTLPMNNPVKNARVKNGANVGKWKYQLDMYNKLAGTNYTVQDIANMQRDFGNGISVDGMLGQNTLRMLNSRDGKNLTWDQISYKPGIVANNSGQVVDQNKQPATPQYTGRQYTLTLNGNRKVSGTFAELNDKYGKSAGFMKAMEALVGGPGKGMNNVWSAINYGKTGNDLNAVMDQVYQTYMNDQAKAAADKQAAVNRQKAIDRMTGTNSFTPPMI